jgi:alpha-amylase
MKRTTLCLAFHNHQPVGNFPWVFDSAYHQAYLPLVECLERHPAVRVSLHYTGPLLDWLERERPEFLDRVTGLVQRGQVEMMTGGYYEPILPSIPDVDRVGQIRKLTDYVAHRFGYQATGMWLAERVWEPQLPQALRAAGVDWTIVDDTHFKMIGLTDADLTGYYLTEDQGHLLKVFATSKRLRYVIPWASVAEVISELQGMASEDPDLVAVMGDDGEKFGVWPGTYDHCWTHGWMEQFFQQVEANAAWLQLIPVGEYARAHSARGRVYLPTASYAEMLEWALPAAAGAEYHRVFHEAESQHRDDLTRFLRGGFWRNFLVKYEEVNTMHKKMLRAHHKAYATGAPPDAVALDELWQGQCNCPYWHGVFGGIYMTDVRSATYRHLIRSERRSDEIARGTSPWIASEQTDFDCDSRLEAIIESGAGAYLFAPALGGSLVEWDARAAAHNLVSVMTRRPEAYHETLRASAGAAAVDESGGAKTIHDVVRVKEAGLERFLAFDWYRRACLLDHFLPVGVTREDFANCRYPEAGDFVAAPYNVEIMTEASRAVITLQREGTVKIEDATWSVEVAKAVEIDARRAGFLARYTVTNRSPRALQSNFGVELNLNLLGGGGNPTAYRRLGTALESQNRFDAAGEASDVAEVVAGNEHLGIEVRFAVNRPATTWWSSIESISSSEGGFERVHQGSALLFQWPLKLAPAETFQIVLTADVAERSVES